MEWTTQVVDHLRHYKDAGLPFEEAWHQALIDAPPRGRDCGPLRPTLLDEDTSLVGFFQRACRDAWNGDRPALLHFHPSLLRDLDRSSPAIRTRRFAA